MRNKYILKEHYKQWADTAKNKFHKEYATIMYNAVLNGTHKETYSELGSLATPLYDPENEIIYRSIGEAARAFKVSPASMGINYKRYGLIKKKM